MLQLDGIEAGYGNVQILNGVSLAVERGQIVALLGGIGTGKSTLLKTISGLLAPWRGAIRFRSFERVYEYFPRLAERRRQFAATLSGGELQMLCIGRGLMSQPRMMLLDEPSAALAPQIVLDIFRTISRICRAGMTLLLVEQNVRMALLLAEYAYVLRDGAIHIEGRAEELIAEDAVRLSYLGGTVADRGAASSGRARAPGSK